MRITLVVMIGFAVALSSCATKEAAQRPVGSMAEGGTFTYASFERHVASQDYLSKTNTKQNTNFGVLEKSEAKPILDENGIVQSNSRPGTSGMPEPQVYDNMPQAQIDNAQLNYLFKKSPSSNPYDDVIGRVMFPQQDVSFDQDGEPNIFRTFLP